MINCLNQMQINAINISKVLLAPVVMSFTCSLRVLGSIVGWDCGCTGSFLMVFCNLCGQTPGQKLTLCRDCFSPHPSQFFIHSASTNMTLRSLSYLMVALLSKSAVRYKVMLLTVVMRQFSQHTVQGGGWTADELWFNSWQGQEIFLFEASSLWGPPHPYHQ